MDNGPPLLRRTWITRCPGVGREHARIPTHTPHMNANIEACHAPLERECLQRQEFQDFAATYQMIGDWITYYNTRRLHGRLADWAPTPSRQRVAVGEARWIPLRV